MLVVEDDADVGQLVERSLAPLGYRVVLTSRPEQAERLFAKNEAIVLLISDVVMPDMSGPTLFRRLAALRPGLRVLFISGSDRGLLDSDARLLRKPFVPETLARAVREALDARPSSG